MRYILGLILLFSSSVFAASGSGNVSSVIGFGGFGITNGSNTATVSPPNIFIPAGSQAVAGSAPLLKVLVSFQVNGTGATYNAFFDPSDGTNTQYVVPGSKKFYVSAICWDFLNSTNSRSFSIGSATAAFTTGTTSVPTGSSIWGNATGTAVNGAGFRIPAVQAGGQSVGCFNFPTSFNTGKYPLFYWEAAAQEGGVFLVGQEL